MKNDSNRIFREFCTGLAKLDLRRATSVHVAMSLAVALVPVGAAAQSTAQQELYERAVRQGRTDMSMPENFGLSPGIVQATEQRLKLAPGHQKAAPSVEGRGPRLKEASGPSPDIGRFKKEIDAKIKARREGAAKPAQEVSPSVGEPQKESRNPYLDVVGRGFKHVREDVASLSASSGVRPGAMPKLG